MNKFIDASEAFDKSFKSTVVEDVVIDSLIASYDARMAALHLLPNVTEEAWSKPRKVK